MYIGISTVLVLTRNAPEPKTVWLTELLTPLQIITVRRLWHNFAVLNTEEKHYHPWVDCTRMTRNLTEKIWIRRRASWQRIHTLPDVEGKQVSILGWSTKLRRNDRDLRLLPRRGECFILHYLSVFLSLFVVYVAVKYRNPFCILQLNS